MTEKKTKKNGAPAGPKNLGSERRESGEEQRARWSREDAATASERTSARRLARARRRTS